MRFTMSSNPGCGRAYTLWSCHFFSMAPHPAGTLAASQNEALVEMPQMVVVVTAAWKVLGSCPATSQAISLARFSAVPNGWDLASSMDARRRWGPPWAQCMLLLDLKWKIAWLASFLHHQGKSWEQGSSWDEKDVLHLSKSPIYF